MVLDHVHIYFVTLPGIVESGVESAEIVVGDGSVARLRQKLLHVLGDGRNFAGRNLITRELRASTCAADAYRGGRIVDWLTGRQGAKIATLFRECRNGCIAGIGAGDKVRSLQRCEEENLILEMRDITAECAAKFVIVLDRLNCGVSNGIDRPRGIESSTASTEKVLWMVAQSPC